MGGVIYTYRGLYRGYQGGCQEIRLWLTWEEAQITRPLRVAYSRTQAIVKGYKTKRINHYGSVQEFDRHDLETCCKRM